jgi:hypothetical protein
VFFDESMDGLSIAGSVLVFIAGVIAARTEPRRDVDIPVAGE